MSSLEVRRACGIEWTAKDVERFLTKCRFDAYTACLIWTGAKSRGRGNTKWYGSFKVRGKTVRAHKFYAVAVLRLRPRPKSVEEEYDHLDHFCDDSLCVRHIQCVPEAVNLKLRWIRVQVGLDDDRPDLTDNELVERYGDDPAFWPCKKWRDDPLRDWTAVPFK